MNKKKLLRSTIIGFVLLLLSLLITGLVGISDMVHSGVDYLYWNEFHYGFANTLTNYWLIWRPGILAHEVAYIGQVIFFIAIVTTLTLIVMSIAKKKPLYIIPALLLGASIAYLPFMLLLVVPMVQLGVLGGMAMAILSGVTGLVFFAIFFEFLACKEMFKESLALLNKAGGEDEKFEEQKVCDRPAGLSEKEVRAIVEKYLAEHVDELHADEEPAPAPAPAPVKEPEPEPEPEEEPEEEEEEEAPADDNSPVGLNIKGKRRRASFETRLKNSEFDIRHKYYDLRDYIKWYGLRNRISIPGDTFSYKRQRYVFVTIVGKHIRVYLNLDPANYADSTIPVEKAEAKKYEDLPCLLRVKSDLSYRRAKKLVDDLMQKIGIPQPDEDAPKETQDQQ